MKSSIRRLIGINGSKSLVFLCVCIIAAAIFYYFLPLYWSDPQIGSTNVLVTLGITIFVFFMSLFIPILYIVYFCAQKILTPKKFATHLYLILAVYGLSYCSSILMIGYIVEGYITDIVVPPLLGVSLSSVVFIFIVFMNNKLNGTKNN